MEERRNPVEFECRNCKYWRIIANIYGYCDRDYKSINSDGACRYFRRKDK